MTETEVFAKYPDQNCSVMQDYAETLGGASLAQSLVRQQLDIVHLEISLEASQECHLVFWSEWNVIFTLCEPYASPPSPAVGRAKPHVIPPLLLPLSLHSFTLFSWPL